jgi:hypothetical protein
MNRSKRSVISNSLAQIQARHFRKVQIEKHHLNILLLQYVQGLFSAAGTNDGSPGAFEGTSECILYGLFILNDQDLVVHQFAPSFGGRPLEATEVEMDVHRERPQWSATQA